MPSFSAHGAAPLMVEQVRASCASLKDMIAAAQRHDLVTRTNRGRAYEGVARLLEAMSLRLENNKINRQVFEQLHIEYLSRLESFRASYVAYDGSITNLERTNCLTKPEEFITILNEARVRRATIGADVIRIDETLEHYRAAVGEFKTQLEQLTVSPTDGGVR